MYEVFYGVNNKEIDVTHIVNKLLRDSSRIEGSYNELFGDPCPERKKRLCIKAYYNIYLEENSIIDRHLVYRDYNSFDWVTYVLNHDDLHFIKTKEEALNHLEEYGKRENRFLFPLWSISGNLYLVSEDKEIIECYKKIAYYAGKTLVEKLPEQEVKLLKPEGNVIDVALTLRNYPSVLLVNPPRIEF